MQQIVRRHLPSRLGRLRAYSTQASQPPIVSIKNATFYRQHPASTADEVTSNPPLFPGLTFELPSFSKPNQHWSVLSPSSSARTAFFQVLRGQLLCDPPNARTYPYLSSEEIEKKDLRL